MLCGDPCEGDTQTHGLRRLFWADASQDDSNENEAWLVLTNAEDIGDARSAPATGQGRVWRGSLRVADPLLRRDDRDFGPVGVLGERV